MRRGYTGLFITPSSLAYFILSSVWGGSKQPLAFLKPYLVKRLEERTLSDDHPVSPFVSPRLPTTELFSPSVQSRRAPHQRRASSPGLRPKRPLYEDLKH